MLTSRFIYVFFFLQKYERYVILAPITKYKLCVYEVFFYQPRRPRAVVSKCAALRRLRLSLASFPGRKIRPGTHGSHMHTIFRKIIRFMYSNKSLQSTKHLLMSLAVTNNSFLTPAWPLSIHSVTPRSLRLVKLPDRSRVALVLIQPVLYYYSLLSCFPRL